MKNHDVYLHFKKISEEIRSFELCQFLINQYILPEIEHLVNIIGNPTYRTRKHIFHFFFQRCREPNDFQVIALYTQICRYVVDCLARSRKK